MPMSMRDRVLKAIKFDYPDRIPVAHSALQKPAVIKYGRKLIDILNKYPGDFGQTSEYKGIDLSAPEWQPDEDFEETIVDKWGTTIRSTRKGLGGYMIKPALEDWSKWQNYKLPEPPADRGPEFEKEYEKMQRMKETTVAWGGCESIGENLRHIRGYENALLDLASGEPRIRELADALSNYNIALIERALKMKCDVVGWCDDWGSQTALLINPKLWREFFRPYYQKWIDIIHEGGALAFMHSDGCIIEIVPDLMEMGLDCLNPQFSCHDLKELAGLVRGRLCILADIDRQHILPHGAPDEVRSYVKKCIDLFATEAGGFIGRGEIKEDVPLENAEAMFKAFQDFGIIRRD